GRLQKEMIEVLTHGGSVGNFAVEASDLLSLDIGNTGILFCMPNTASLRSPISGELLYDVYSSSQGFLAYNLSANKASAPFAEYNDIEGRLYPLLQQKIGSIP